MKNSFLAVLVALVLGSMLLSSCYWWGPGWHDDGGRGHGGERGGGRGGEHGGEDRGGGGGHH